MPVQEVAEAVVRYGGLALVHGCALALITWLLGATLLRRSRPAALSALWTIVLVKFLLPPVLPGEMALSGWIAQTLTSAAVAPTADVAAVSPMTDVQPLSGAAEGALAGLEGTAAAPLLVFSYLIILALLAGRFLLALARTRRRLAALPASGSATREEVRALAARMGLKRAPEVKTTRAETTPYVTGYRRSVLVLPEPLMQSLEPREREALILHELAHLRRRDQLIRSLQSIVSLLFFFFPPVRWICRRVEHFTEMACDRWAVEVSGIEPSLYAEALVKVVRQMSRQMSRQMERSPQTGSGMALIPGARRLEERLRALLQDDAGRSPRLPLRLKMVLATWSLFALSGGSAAEARQEMLNKRQAGGGAAQMSSTSNPHAEKDDPKPPPVRSMRAAQRPMRRRPANHALPEAPPQISDQVGSRKEESRELTPWEAGFLLGRRYAEERAQRAASRPDITGPIDRSLASGSAQARREIELRMQKINRPPPGQSRQ